MGRISFNEKEKIKRVTINNPIRIFLIIFSIFFIILMIVLYISGVKIEPGVFGGLSQPVLYLIAIIILIVVVFFFSSPKSEFILDMSSRELVLIRTNFAYIKNKYNLGKNNNIVLVGKKKFSIIGTKDEGIVRAYKPFLRFSKENNQKSVKLFPWTGILYIQSADWDNTFSLTKKELEKISEFLDIKLIIE